MARVENTYNIDEDVLSDKAEASDYWQRSYHFYLDMKGREVETLSPAQTSWLEKIEQAVH
jgi:hypothetical protein